MTVYTSTGQSSDANNLTELPGGYNHADSINSGLCYVKTGSVLISETESLIEVTIPQIIRACGRFGGGGTHTDYERNIVVTLVKH